jgi:hypothetical protein
MSKVRRRSFTSVETSKQEKMDVGRMTVQWCASGALEHYHSVGEAAFEDRREAGGAGRLTPVDRRGVGGLPEYRR